MKGVSRKVYFVLFCSALLWTENWLRKNEMLLYVGYLSCTIGEDLDGQLPGGGWPDSGLVELLPNESGIGELRLLMPALAKLSREARWIAWIAPPYLPYAPALASAGIVALARSTTRNEPSRRVGRIGLPFRISRNRDHAELGNDPSRCVFLL